MKFVSHLPPQKPSKQEKIQKLKDLEIGDCFRFFDGVSFEDAKRKAAQSFFFVTASNGPKPAEDKIPCLTLDMKGYRHLDSDRDVIKHEINAAILPAVMLEIAVKEFIQDESETA